MMTFRFYTWAVWVFLLALCWFLQSGWGVAALLYMGGAVQLALVELLHYNVPFYKGMLRGMIWPWIVARDKVGTNNV